MAGYTAQLAVAIRLATAERVICGHSNIRLMNRYSGSITRMSYSHGTCIRLILTGFCSNVDRLFALYQVQNPNAYLQPSNVGSAGNVFVEDNTVVDGDTPLLPFRRSPGSFWTTNEAMDWRIFGYDYPKRSRRAPQLHRQQSYDCSAAASEKGLQLDKRAQLGPLLPQVFKMLPTPTGSSTQQQRPLTCLPLS